MSEKPFQQYIRKTSTYSHYETEKKDTASLEKRRLIVGSVMVAKRYKMQSLLARRLNLRPGYLGKLHKSSTEVALRSKRRADATCIDVVNNIREFYKNPKVSRELPYMKTVLKQEQKYLLKTSVESAYDL